MHIYTRSGDNGTTFLPKVGRVSKTHARVEALGELDALLAQMGAVVELADTNIVKPLLQIQHELMCICGALALQSDVCNVNTALLEEHIESLTSEIPPPTGFILPGGCSLGVQLHVARTVARRAERRVVALAESAPVAPEILAYCNRLSDYLFALALYVNHQAGTPEMIWENR